MLIAFRFHKAYNQIEENTKIRRFPKILQKFVEKVLTFPKSRIILKTEHLFVFAELERSFRIMTENKTELIRLILENDNIEQAIVKASAIIHDLLTQHESSVAQVSACLQVCGQTSPSY